MRSFLLSGLLVCTSAMTTVVASPAAKAQDVSPVLLIETGPNDRQDYRRVVFVKYLSGHEVTANYRADNRTEFKRVDPKTPQALIDSCASGPATRLSDIISYSRDENRRLKSGKAPQVRSFCIKNVRDWQRSNRDVYLDPIFEGLPVSIQGL